jgi:LPS-assembly lipoprotein
LKRLPLIALTTLFTVLLSACGFHLNVKNALPKIYNKLYLTSVEPYSYFTKSLTQTLSSQQITIVNSATQAPLTLNILNENLNYTQTSVGSSQQTRQYQINYTVTIQVQSPKGQVMAGPFNLTQSMTQTMFANQLLENTQQLAEDKRQLERKMINQIFYHLAARDTIKSINTYLAKKR